MVVIVTGSHRFDDCYAGKQPVAWKEYYAEDWLKELEESMDRCTGCSNITEILLKRMLNTIQSINKTKLKAFADINFNVSHVVQCLFGKWRKCWLTVFAPFPTVSSKGFFPRVVKRPAFFFLSPQCFQSLQSHKYLKTFDISPLNFFYTY